MAGGNADLLCMVSIWLMPVGWTDKIRMDDKVGCSGKNKVVGEPEVMVTGLYRCGERPEAETT